MNKLIYIISCLLITLNTYAEINYIPTEEGYWHYEIIKEEEKENNYPAPNPLPSEEKLMELHPDQIQKLIQIWRKRAIHTLKSVDVEQYLIVQEVARKKAAAFAANVGYVVQTNSNLSLNDEIPITNAGIQTKFNEKENNKDKILHKYKNKYGLAYFYLPNCTYCLIQEPIIERFLTEYKYKAESFHLQKNAVITNKFNVTQAPSVILLKKGSNKWMPISFGVQSKAMFEKNIYRSILFLEGLITQSQYFTNIEDINTGLDPLNNK